MLLLAVAAIVAGAQRAEAQEAPPNAEELLRHFVLEGTVPTVPLPKIAIEPSLAADDADVTLRNVIRRDLELCGEFEVMKDSEAPDGLYLSDTPVNVAAWKDKGAEAVVKLSGKKLGNGKAQLKGVAFFTDQGDKPVFEKTFEIDDTRVRAESHRVADALIGALTGTPGGFSSQMTFVFGSGRARRVYVMDADGHDPRAVSSDDQLALTPAFGPGHQLYYAASVNHGAFKVFAPGNAAPLRLEPRGSVYGLTFSRDGGELALSIAVGAGIKIYRGPSFDRIQPASDNTFALHPTFSPSGKLAFAGAGRWSQRIFVDGKAVSPDGLHASAPVFCKHPSGIKLVYALGAGRKTDLVVAPELGGAPMRITGAGSNGYPACSPDGRLVAFFSTRTNGEGPGLYVMRVDGTRPKRVSTLVGDSLRWSRLPEG